MKLQTCLESNKPCLPISVIADMLSVHQRTLRIYDIERILVPQRSPKGRRLYSMDDIERGKFIQYLTRNIGINLAGIKIIFELLKELKMHNPNLDGVQQIDVIKQITEDLGLTLEMQKNNCKKMSNRGRKKEIINV